MLTEIRRKVLNIIFVLSKEKNNETKFVIIINFVYFKRTYTRTHRKMN